MIRTVREYRGFRSSTPSAPAQRDQGGDELRPGVQRHPLAGYVHSREPAGKWAMNALQLTSEHANDFVVITVAGELDLATRPDLSAFAQDVIGTRPGTVIIDLAGVTFIDACGLSALIVLRRHARDLGTLLLLAEAPPVVLRLIKLTDLEGSFTVISHMGGLRGPLAEPARTEAPVQA
jgi:anti-sigma B factor antagonist